MAMEDLAVETRSISEHVLTLKLSSLIFLKLIATQNSLFLLGL
jgi:hypothetical protein